MSIEKVMSDDIKDKEDIKRQITKAGDVTTYYLIYSEELRPRHILTKIDIRGVGSSFVLGDTVFGVLGISTPQPYLGDSRPVWTNKVNTTYTTREFLDGGKNQIRDFLIGSSAAVAPTTLLIGSGTFTWNDSLTTLGSLAECIGIDTYSTEDNKLGSFISILPSVVANGTYSELGISGGQLFIYDSFTAQTLPSAGSEMRFTVGIRVGS